MRFLLDVNALIAWGHGNAQDHAAFHAWRKKRAGATLVSCAITELGFLRVSMVAFHLDAAQAAALLATLKREMREFAAESPSPNLPKWATTAGRTTDAYLTQLASHHGATLATFDRGIPAAEVIR